MMKTINLTLGTKKGFKNWTLFIHNMGYTTTIIIPKNKYIILKNQGIPVQG